MSEQFPFVDSTFTVALFNGSTSIGSVTFNAPNDTTAFFGVWSDVAFDRVQIRETVGGIEDEYFGQFYTGQLSPIVPVTIDIKPDSYPNVINLGSGGLIPVAIFSSASFDATQIDADTVELAGAGVAIRGRGDNFFAEETDVNSDGLIDLLIWRKARPA